VSLLAVPHEPDAVAWIGTKDFVTTNKGDMEDGGSQGFTIFDTKCKVVYSSGTRMIDWMTHIRDGYPQGSSYNRLTSPRMKTMNLNL
jgi:hypothetical protein